MHNTHRVIRNHFLSQAGDNVRTNDIEAMLKLLVFNIADYRLAFYWVIPTMQLRGEYVECRLARHNRIPSRYVSVACKSGFRLRSVC
jgi:hypothetical protein